MESNNIISAPQINGFNALYDRWKQDHTGSKNDFFLFMTAPSRERDDFMSSPGVVVTEHFAGAVVELTVSAESATQETALEADTSNESTL